MESVNHARKLALFDDHWQPPAAHRRRDERPEGDGRLMARNMFGPVRGAWADPPWNGWWEPNPPYHTPVFVLTTTSASHS